jgi:transcriptional regulator with XRE-family HTH domain
MNISDRIQNLRKSKGISQEELADKAGVSRQAVSKWESEQSVPDIDKIIILSEYFEVTTDYLLKGIENEKQASEKPKVLDANIFLFPATFLNFIGLIVASAVWYDRQIVMAVVTGLIFMAMGCMQFGIGWSFSTINQEKSKRTFWQINIWLLVFIPLSFIYNVLFTGFTAPYPLVGESTIMFGVFWLVYIAVCLSVMFLQIKHLRRDR